MYSSSQGPVESRTGSSSQWDVLSPLTGSLRSNACDQTVESKRELFIRRWEEKLLGSFSDCLKIPLPTIRSTIRALDQASGKQSGDTPSVVRSNCRTLTFVWPSVVSLGEFGAVALWFGSTNNSWTCNFFFFQFLNEASWKSTESVSTGWLATWAGFQRWDWRATAAV